MNPLTCRAAVRAASDELAGVLSDVERDGLQVHLAGCENCSCLMDQLRTTVAFMGSRAQVQMRQSFRAMTHEKGDRAEALTAQVPRLYALANALDPNTADDLVQETLTSALADPEIDTTASGLAVALAGLADERGPDFQTPVAPTAGSDPDADEAELFYPDFYTDGADAGAWVDPPVAWGETRVLRPEEDLVTTEAYGVVDAALAKIDPIDAGLVTLIDIEKAPFGRAVVDLDLPSGEARERLARGRFAVRAALDRHLRS